MSYPLVSILIPCYNAEKFLDETLHCCVEQTYSNIEIIVVDDGSTDDSLKKLKRWESKYQQIHVYAQTNQGAAHARNVALSKSHGEYVMYLDADDIISLNKVESQVKRLINGSKNEVAFCPWTRFYESIDDAKYVIRFLDHDFDHGRQLLIDMWNDASNVAMIACHCYLVSRQLIEQIGGWNETLTFNDDGEFFSRILLHCRKVHFVENAYAYYRTGKYVSMSRVVNYQSAKSHLDSYRLLIKNSIPIDNSIEMRTALCHNLSYYMYLYYALFPSLVEEAKQLIKTELNLKPIPEGPHRVKRISRIIGYETFLKLRKLILKR